MQANADMTVKKRGLFDEIVANKKQKEILSKKIDVSNKNKAVDNEAGKLIRTIQKFLIRFKDEKRERWNRN